ncbi:hypothetical protein M406DRAFT_109289 [Cryphonectria parasitica EP155]|uniref:Chromo domain-containing protein n=1 Tax=Cryphonectria parasitica (strain ATCC 38755 / EP155) TaxID=660469 RepID=A0A9P4XSM2_CRYP1|nr:uncharacterized protein M406DRAFT_109289 [Cryphonectria parasitica EP155]KAF3760178.1 hypothetical protein M406DRAFT_109289 [Cryphonectria parasitica EP155]
MSSPERRTRTSSSQVTGNAAAATTTTTTTASQSPRRYTRKKNNRKRDRSPPPTPAKKTKKRKLRDDILQDNFYAIKDIIDEKFIGSQRYYKIDWEDHPITGETFEPSWEPEENANEEAVEDWEWEKQRQVLLGVAPSSPRSSQDQATESSPSSHPGTIYIELQSKSDFLKSRPDFDTADVLTISASQLSNFSYLDCENELPPPQFLIISSNPGQGVIGTADSQSVIPGSDLSQQAPTAIRTKVHVSQTTIPDSQEFSTDISQDPIEVSWTGAEPPQSGLESHKVSHKESSGSSVPSRQPDSNQLSFEHDSISFHAEGQLLSQGHPPTPPLQPALDSQASARLPSSRNTFERFLTQPPFEAGEFSLSTNSRIRSQDPIVTTSGSQQLASSAQNTPLEDSHQPAQEISPLSNQQQSHFLTQTEAFFSASEDYEIVPETSQEKSAFRVHQHIVPTDTKSRLAIMDDSQPAESERSALEALRAIQMQFSIPPHMRRSSERPVDAAQSSGEANRTGDEPPTPISPSDIISTVELDSTENPGQASPAFAAAAVNHILEPGGPINDDMPATISPSVLLATTVSDPLLEASSQDSDVLAAADPLAEAKTPDTVMRDEERYGILPSAETAANQYIITLPPPARARAQWPDILKLNRQEMEAFKVTFSQNAPGSPNDRVIARIDTMLHSLGEMSNLPPYHKDLESLTQVEWMRYARDTTSKLSFIYEFLDRLRDVQVEIVILTAGGAVAEKVEAIVSQGGFTYRHAQQQDWSHPSSEDGSACKVVLVDTTQPAQPPRLTENIVIAYDETAETSGVLQPYKTRELNDQTPLIFSLVEFYSLEHINQRLSPRMDPMERRFAQLECIAALAGYAEDETVLEGIPPPHQFASDLARYLVDETGFHPPDLRWDTWEHQHVPDIIFDYYKSARDQVTSDGNRKRRREDAGEEVEKSKRVRMGRPSDEEQLSEELMARFGNSVQLKDGMALVSLEKLEDLVGLVKDLQVGLNRKSEEVKSHIMTIQRFHPKYYDAIGERGKFEAERNQALQEKERVQKELERSESKVAKLAEDRQQLEAQLRELTESENPTLAEIAQREIALKKAQDAAASAERQAASIRKDLDFARDRYQDASDKAAALGQENAELRQQVRDLEARASTNLIEIRRIATERTDASLRHKWLMEREARLDREREIERRNEDMRVYKARFGGRETRGSSVPRSPRIRQVSSRNTSPVGDSNNNIGGPIGSGNGNGGNGNGLGGNLFGPRGSHLREL